MRTAELVFFYGGLPLLALLGWIPRNPIPYLMAAFLVCWLMLRRDPGFSFSTLWYSAALRGQLWPITRIFALLSCLLAGVVVMVAPELLFSFIRERPLVWLLVMVLYPLLSVVPQELVYRVFFFQRYQNLFRTRKRLALASAVAFGHGHVIYENPWAVILTLLGGALFAYRYEKTRSLLVISLEHAMYGMFLFTIGLSKFFDHYQI